jgi:replicative DNA helicase
LRAVHESMDQVIDGLDREPRFYPTPYHSLDEKIGGFEPGALYIIGARPGSGKTNMLLQCAASLAHKGLVAFSSLEMTEEQLQLRLLAQYGEIDVGSLRTRKLAQSDWEKVAKAKSALNGAPIFIDDRASATIADIRAYARSVARRSLLTGVCVDYLQLVRSTEAAGRRSRTEVVDGIAQDLHELAKDLDVPVVAAAQLKRAPQQRGRKRVLPTLEDLREAGGIEQAADAVLLLDRDPTNPRDEIDVVVAKNRQGEQGRFRLRWKGRFARMDDIPWSPFLDSPEEEPRP